MSQNNIVSIKSIAEAAFAGYPGSLAPMLEKTINKVFDYLESSLQEASLVHDCWVFENTANMDLFTQLVRDKTTHYDFPISLVVHTTDRYVAYGIEYKPDDNPINNLSPN